MSFDGVAIPVNLILDLSDLLGVLETVVKRDPDFAIQDLESLDGESIGPVSREMVLAAIDNVNKSISEAILREAEARLNKLASLEDIPMSIPLMIPSEPIEA
jgi:hypothetical protein